jgi:hypothetical protein
MGNERNRSQKERKRTVREGRPTGEILLQQYKYFTVL